jgi:hypothetical protein
MAIGFGGHSISSEGLIVLDCTGSPRSPSAVRQAEVENLPKSAAKASRLCAFPARTCPEGGAEAR